MRRAEGRARPQLRPRLLPPGGRSAVAVAVVLALAAAVAVALAAAGATALEWPGAPEPERSGAVIEGDGRLRLSSALVATLRSPCKGYARVFDRRDTDAELVEALRAVLRRACAEAQGGAQPSLVAPDACELADDERALRSRAGGRERTLELLKTMLHEQCQAEAVRASLGAGGGAGAALDVVRVLGGGAGGRGGNAVTDDLFDAYAAASAAATVAAKDMVLADVEDMAQAEERVATSRSESSSYFRSGAHGIPGLPVRALIEGDGGDGDARAQAAESGVGTHAEDEIVPLAESFGEGTTLVKIRRVERAALRDLYRATNGPRWASSLRWDETQLDRGDYCAWAGVRCQRAEPSDELAAPLEGMPAGVVSLELPSAGLDGTVPPAIGRLRHLKRLDLSGNKLRGALPAEMGELGRLSRLRMQRNALGGEVAVGVLASPALREIDLSDNRLVRVAAALHPAAGGSGEVTQLTLLNVSHNAIGDSLDELVPADCASRWPAVEALSLAQNRLAGAIPPRLGALSNLALLDLAHNGLDGTLPPEIVDGQAMRVLDVSANRLTGSLPADVPSLSTPLRVFAAAANRLTGTLPVPICAASELRHLDVSSNQLEGTLPAVLLDAVNLRLLNASANSFAGPMIGAPSTAASAASAALPDAPASSPAATPEPGASRESDERQRLAQAMGLPAHLMEGTRGGAAVSGQSSGSADGDARAGGGQGRAHGLARLSSLRVLDLSSNALTGPLAPALGTLSALRVLDLSDNALTGSVPESLGSLTRLTALNLSRNELSGAFPNAAVRELRKLARLDLSRNKLSGQLKYESLEGLTSLQTLDTSGNAELAYA